MNKNNTFFYNFAESTLKYSNMKKIIIFTVLCLFAVSTFAQNPALNVPKFKGIEISGTIDQFGSKLASQGFTFLTKDNNSAIYQGRFAGMNDCLIYLIPIENSKDIASVSVLIGLTFSDYGDIYCYETWEKLLSDYESLKDLLTEKYGAPTEQNAGFAQDAITSTSYLKLHAVKEGKSEYYAQWGDFDMDKMVVELSITGGKNMGQEIAVITLKYANVEKSNTARKEILDDL